MKKILISDHLHPAFKEGALKLGFEVDDCPHYTLEQTLKVLHNYQGLAVRTKFSVDKKVIDAGPELEFIARAGAGMDNVDEDYARRRGIACINAPEGNRDAVAEHALGMLLALMNNLSRADREVRQGIWDREGNRGMELCGRTVAIIGYGNMGRSFAQRLAGFNVNTLAYDKYRHNYSDAWARQTSMEHIFETADVLSLHIPLTAETRRLVNDDFLSGFKKPLLLLNTARGEIVDTASVLRAIDAKRITGAALDVLEVEKAAELMAQPWFKELAANPRVLLSPHVAGWSVESYRKISEVLADKLALLGLH